MSTPHHGGSPEDQAEQLRLKSRLLDQFMGQAKREYPQGRAGGDDEGSLAFAIAADEKHGIVRIEFGKPVDWLGLPPKEAIELAQLLIKQARTISKEPVRISLH